jgi:hypothetical protein
MEEGNWVPAWSDSLKELTVEEALWKPEKGYHCIWQEVVHVNYWRSVTLVRMAGGDGPTEEEVNRLEFALPKPADEAAWAHTLSEFRSLHDALADAIIDETRDISRLTYHLIHDAYHLGRVTQLRAMQGMPPAF